MLREEINALIDTVDEIYSVRGKNVRHLDLRAGRPDRETILDLVLGPTGKLRAPTLRLGNTLIVGFEQDLYTREFQVAAE